MIELETLALPLVFAGGGLYATYAFDLLHDERSAPGHHLQIEAGELVLWATALIVMLGWMALHHYNARRSESALRHQAEARARALGYYDGLTQIANRRAFDEMLVAVLAQPLEADQSHAVMMLDLNGFKQINDLHGHAIGDVVLQAVARRLADSVRASDLAARFGGDEFALILPEAGDAVTVEAIARRICVAIEAPIEIDGRQHRVSAGIGIAMHRGEPTEPAELVRRADAALYAAKADGGGTWRFHGAACSEAA